jgi:hypothetical protein
VAVGLVFAETKSGNPQVVVRFKLLDADVAGSEINWYGHFTEKTEDRTLESLQAAGWKGTDLSALSLEDLNAEVSLVIEPKPRVDADLQPVLGEDGQAVVQPEVRWVNRAGLAVQQQLAPDKMQLLAARLKGKLAASQAMAKPRTNGTPPPSARPSPPPNLEEPPF